MEKLATCLLNISTASVEVVQQVAMAGARGGGKGAAIINVFRDEIYNRSVISLSGKLGQLKTGVVEACIEGSI